MRKLSLAAAFVATAVIGAAWSYAAAQSEMVDGQVKKIDASASKITLKHGPIKKFDMDDGMTMVFRVQDPGLLKQVKIGDKVKFEADKVNGQFTVTKMQKSR
jgi:Cu/Ag efflux protein CusF